MATRESTGDHPFLIEEPYDGYQGVQYNPQTGYGNYDEVQRYLKMEKVKRHLESQARRKLISERYMSFRDFIPRGFKIIEPRNTYIPNWHIDAMADHLMAVIKGDIQNLIINIPPRYMKSLTVSVFWPAWTWTLIPEMQFVYASYSSGLAIRDSIKTRRLIQSPWYQSQWSEIVAIRQDQNQKTRFENTEAGYRIATSVLGAATGEGGNIIIVDDPHNMKEIFSEYKRNEAIDWWNTVMSTRVNNPKTDHRVIISQRGHENDLVGHLLKSMERHHTDTEEALGEEIEHYETLILPAEYVPKFTDFGDDVKRKPKTSIGFSDPRTEENELLYPQRFNRKVIEALKESLGPYASSAQLQQNPVPAGGAVFSISTLRCWAPAHLINHYGPARVKDTSGKEYKLDTIALPTGNEITDGLSCDFSFSDFSTSSYVVIQVWRNVGPNHYLIHQSKAQRDFKGTMVSLGKIVAKFPSAQLRLFELKANGFAIYSSLRDKISGIIPITPKESKVARAQAVSPILEAGNVIIPHPLYATWVHDLILDWISFPFGQSDDSVDGMTQWLNYKAFGPQVTIS